ncbi:YigZ family protein [Shewanella sp. NFH-SH190041]|uniref:YigZ family protein n=1 Tax=Shewanella sp. NFH-SH190041 TaxID=2950245 RepID=UPI0021C42230|nr:YigZ family protein [Shewanella sp. NFH-SH190041]BDM62560.1 YigZ family protein [Shewanella sp. NFH-SH190041]
MSERYPIPAQELIFEEEIKHSHFISVLFHCASPEHFKQQLNDIRLRYPGATHYCQAFLTGKPGCTMTAGFSDDGEPAGSAGRPMLAVLQGSGIGEIGAVVIRYYGGIKLGVGGLVRAYASGIKQALPQLPTLMKQIRFPGTLACDYARLRDVEYVLEQHDGVIVDRQFGAEIVLAFELPRSQQEAVNTQLATISQGCVQAHFDN